MIRRTNSTTPEQAQDLNQPVDLFAGPINLDMVIPKTSTSNNGQQTKRPHHLRHQAKVSEQQQQLIAQNTADAHAQQVQAKSVKNTQNKQLLRDLDHQQATRKKMPNRPKKDPNLRK